MCTCSWRAVKPDCFEQFARLVGRDGDLASGFAAAVKTFRGNVGVEFQEQIGLSHACHFEPARLGAGRVHSRDVPGSNSDGPKQAGADQERVRREDNRPQVVGARQCDQQHRSVEAEC